MPLAYVCTNNKEGNEAEKIALMYILFKKNSKKTSLLLNITEQVFVLSTELIEPTLAILQL